MTRQLDTKATAELLDGALLIAYGMAPAPLM